MAKDPNFDLPLLCKQGKSSFFFGLPTSIDNPLLIGGRWAIVDPFYWRLHHGARAMSEWRFHLKRLPIRQFRFYIRYSLCRNRNLNHILFFVRPSVPPKKAKHSPRSNFELVKDNGHNG
jgi:hypothetical protein